ncbi:WD40-repeat-containing domain protein [Exophiala viscosa]|uniref:WD40-repeat-containing domain protein n=1 Tax=Exophiala viscosa TaxID=2486360 RepID=UPI002194FC9E|nr:WD40-repeat-containing domain protein [Exophiala viscosa]
MDLTPERPPRGETVTFAVAADESQNLSPRRISRPKKNPSVTPRRFNRFFTPRTRNVQRAVRTSRKALQDLSAARLNSRRDPPQHPNKKRKLSFSSVPSLPSSPIKRDTIPSSQSSTQAGEGQRLLAEDDSDFECFDTEADEKGCAPRTYPARLVPYRSVSSSAAALYKRLGGRKTVVDANDSRLWQNEAANFYSSSEDFYGYNRRFASLPFCAAGFKTVSLVAIGDEDGSVRIHDVSGPAIPYSEVFLTMHPHDNAIMDMELSSDDALLATASGDQTCRIIDMKKQIATHTLIGHTGSIKRVQFQPGSGNNILATCSRDGSVCLWDLRCAKAKGSTMFKELRRESEGFLNDNREVNAVNDIRDAHTSSDGSRISTSRRPVPVSARNDFAVTTCAFMDQTRPHLLATASENNAIVKLWDMRTSYKQRSGKPNPVSATEQPKSHENVRPFGVTSIAFNTDGSRLYSLCRDHTVYTYSTAHLVLGSASEMSLSSSRPFRQSRQTGHGLGPMYGFRHPKLRLQTFYDKLAIRHRAEDQTEIIATGSSEECAVLFPTDERYLNQATRGPHPDPRIVRTEFPMSTPDGHCPIYYHGTALVKGHRKEVTAVAWTHNGNLVTTADDYTTRCWREDADEARALRLNTERDAYARYMSGWADVLDGYDDDGDEEDDE